MTQKTSADLDRLHRFASMRCRELARETRRRMSYSMYQWQDWQYLLAWSADLARVVAFLSELGGSDQAARSDWLRDFHEDWLDIVQPAQAVRVA